MFPYLPHRKVEFPILDAALVRRGAPARVVYALFRLHNDLVHLIHQILFLRLQAANDVSVNSARVQGDGRDGRVATR